MCANSSRPASNNASWQSRASLPSFLQLKIISKAFVASAPPNLYSIPVKPLMISNPYLNIEKEIKKAKKRIMIGFNPSGKCWGNKKYYNILINFGVAKN
jgi:hypothetical protein